ncbi:procathepsin L-like [Osmerus eperlanus]|uniref:procathepsin L-like n=1 Tax=Osmerus eperlanus TaxID=29151 RepID=UPI002E138883
MTSAHTLKQPLNLEWDKIWDEWKAKHNKEYVKVEEVQRRSNWANNMRLIDQHNLEAAEGKHTYILGMNQFGDMTSQEFNAMLSASAVDESSLDEIPLSKLNESKKESPIPIPCAWDWRKHGCVTNVKNQRKCGSCYAFAAVGALEGQWFKKTGKLLSLSEQELVDCSKSYQMGFGGCKGGSVERCFQYIKDHGILSESKYTYTAMEGKCKNQRVKRDVWCKGLKKVPPKNEKSMKYTLYTVGPLAVSLNASSIHLYKCGVFYEPKCSTKTNHAVLIVGYGKQRHARGRKYWIVKNSWGPGWGQRGYILIARGNNQCGIASRAMYPIV